MKGAPLLIPLLWMAGGSASAGTDATTNADIPAFGIDGSARAGYFSASRELDGVHNLETTSVWLKSVLGPTRGISLVADGWLRNDDSLQGRAFRGQVNDAYLNFDMEQAHVRLGKQIIAWGRADSINPTDNLTPHNYTILTPDDDDERSGTVAALVALRAHGTALTAVWLPQFNPSVLPLPTLPGGHYIEQSVHTNEYAIKLDRSDGGVDWSLSYFNGRELFPQLSAGGREVAANDVLLAHNRVRVLGMDAATVVGRFGLRAEAAYTWTSNGVPGEPFTERPFFYMVAGTYRTFFEYFNLNLQLYLRHVTGYQDPRNIPDAAVRALAIDDAILEYQLVRSEEGLTARLDNKWLNETLDGEIAAAYSLSLHDYVIKPKVSYAFTDRLKGTVGANVYRGSDTTFFGVLRDISSVFVEMKYSF